MFLMLRCDLHLYYKTLKHSVTENDRDENVDDNNLKKINLEIIYHLVFVVILIRHSILKKEYPFSLILYPKWGKPN